MAFLLAAVLGLVPLVIAPHLLFYYDVTGKLALLLAGTALALVFWAVRGDACRSLPAARAGRWFCVLIAAGALSLVISTVLSSNPALSFGGTNWRRFGLVAQLAILLFSLLLASSLVANPDRMRTLLRVTSASGILIGLYGVLQYFGWDPWIPPAAYHVGEGAWEIVRPPATLGHAIYFANFELYVAFFGGALAATDPDRRWKMMGLLAAGVAALSILLSGTRAALLGLAAGAIFLAIRLRPRLTRRTIAAALVISAGLAVLYLLPPGAKLRGRVHWTLTEQPLGGARSLLWRDSLSMAGRRWVSGYGLETFSAEFPAFQSAALARAYPEFYHESPHNLFLDALTAQGIIGLLPLLGLIALAFYAAWKGALADAYTGAALAAALASQQFAVFTVPTALYFFATLAALAVRPRPAPRSDVSQPLIRVALVSASLAGAALLATFAVRLTVSDRALAVVARQLETGRLEQAVLKYQQARQWRVSGGAADLWYSRKLAAFMGQTRDPFQRIQAWPRVMEAAWEATRSAEDRPNAWYNLAAFYAAQNDSGRTEAALRSAIRCAPNWFKPHWMLAQVLRAGGRLSDALREADLAADLNGGHNPEVAHTLGEIRAALPQR
jgi:O-antigen ligase